MVEQVVNPKLTDEQHEAVSKLMGLSSDAQTLGGFAGTGKTVVARELKLELPDFYVCAPTGKAAHVLRRKGIHASTIHSLIYWCVEEVVRDEFDRPSGTRLTWDLKPPEEVDGSGFIVDEASMISEEIYRDLLSYGRPVIFIGDHGQLEPVDDSFNLMAAPDITLETVHRNAGEIAQFANFIREGNPPMDWERHENCSGECVDLSSGGSSDRDIAVCAFNSTRVAMNQESRSLLGYNPDRPEVGDRVICLQNSRELGVFNGMQGTITALLSRDRMRFSSDDQTYEVGYVPGQFNSETTQRSRDKLRLPFDYAYCVTCHKAQGSEWNHVMVIDQKCGSWSHTRWAYTAASRAKVKLTWVK